MSKAVYITTTLPYVNNDPHVGFAMEIIRADVLARYHAIVGNDVFFNTGTDEHGQKLFDDAKNAGKDVKEYVDFYAEKFRGLKDLLGMNDDVHFIRTTDTHHEKAAQELWKLVDKNGFIYKKNYQTKYCVGCELEKTDSELTKGKCPIHPNKEIEVIDEENYFFAFSKLEPRLKELYEQKPNLIIPEFRFKEVKAFLDRGLQDFSISRIKEKMSWGVPVPNDDKHVMYVWFDALTNYISTLGWPPFANASRGEPEDLYEKFWVNGLKIQYCGKDNIRQQSMMWQGILLAANLPTTDNIIIDGFLNGPDGQKMSKSLGNVINPYDVVDLLGTDAVRFYLVHDTKPFDDSPISIEMMKDSYTANLVNGVGNLTNRILKMIISYGVEVELETKEDAWADPKITEYHQAFKNFEMNKALVALMGFVRDMDSFITREEPFKKIKVDEAAAKEDLKSLLKQLWRVAILLEPFMPETSAKMVSAIESRTMPEIPIFPRLEASH